MKENHYKGCPALAGKPVCTCGGTNVLKKSNTAMEIVQQLADAGFNHEPACICERCKNGKEVFLLTSDIDEIILTARKQMKMECAAAIDCLATTSNRVEIRNIVLAKAFDTILALPDNPKEIT